MELHFSIFHRIFKGTRRDRENCTGFLLRKFKREGFLILCRPWDGERLPQLTNKIELLHADEALEHLKFLCDFRNAPTLSVTINSSRGRGR